MRVLIINTAERIGGAAIAANRLMEALKNNGIKAKMLVRNKQTDQVTVVALKKSWRRIWQFTWERIVIWAANGFKRHNLFAVDIANTGTDITSLPEFRQADVIFLERYPAHSCFRETCSMDHARHVAFHRYLPLFRRMREIHCTMS